MTWLHGSHLKRAERLIESILAGEVNTQGKMKSWLDSAAALPPRLREYVFQQLEPSIGPLGVNYLKSLLPLPTRGNRA